MRLCGSMLPHNRHRNLIQLTLIVLTWRIWWAPNNASRWDLTQCLKGKKRAYLVTSKAVYVWRNTEVCSYNCCCSGKAGSITYYECVLVALLIEHAMRMRCIILSWSSVSLYNIFSPTFFIHSRIFGKSLLNIRRVFWFALQLLSDTFLILRGIQGDIIKNIHTYS